MGSERCIRDRAALLQPAYGEESVRYVLYGATFLGLLPAFFFWRCSLRLNEELDQKD